MKEYIHILDGLRPEEVQFVFNPINRNLCFGGGNPLGGLLGGGGAPQPGRSTSEIDADTREIRNLGFDKAKAAANQKFQKYGGDRFAAQSADTQQAFKDIRGMQGRGQDAFTAAGKVGKDVSGYSPDDIKAQSFLGGKGVGEYMSPHTEKVIGGMQKAAMDTMAKQRGALQAQHQMAGAGMGSRGALENAAMMAQVQQGLGQQVAGALEGAYGQAAQMKQQDMQRQMQADQYNQAAGLQAQDVKLRGAQQQMAGAQAGRDAAAQDAQMLSQSGAQQEGYDQREKDFAYDQWQEERDWDKNQAMFLSNIAGAAPHGTSTTTYQPGGQSQQGGMRGALLGAAGGFLQTGSPWGAAAGALGGYA